MDILPEPKFETMSSPPSGFNARLTGVCPTSSSARTLSDFKSIDAICPEPEHATKALLESGRIAMSPGSRQIGSVARTCNFVASIMAVSYTHLRAHETPEHLVCR